MQKSGRHPGGQPIGPAILLLVGIPACFGEESTVFPPGLEPLEANTAPPIEPIDGDPYPEVLSFAKGQRRDHYFGHARAYVKADLATTWAALRTPEVSVDRRQVDEWTVDQGTDPAYAHSYVVHNVVRRVVTLRFDVSWRHDVARGTPEAPEVIAGAWQKTFGSTLIAELKGTLSAEEVAPGVTEVQLIQHLDALQGGADPIESFLNDYYQSLKAQAHGQPLPTY